MRLHRLQLIDEAAKAADQRGGLAMKRLAAVSHEYDEIVIEDSGMCVTRVGENPLPPASRKRLRRLTARVDRGFAA